MSKFKKFMITLGAVVIAGVFYQETQPHYENCSYEILEEEDGAFAKCSCGTIYIGSRDFLKQIPKEEGVILVEDQRRSEDRDPNMKIYDSCFFDSAEDRNEVLEVLLEYEKRDPSSWDRSLESMQLEWLIHNLSYQVRYEEKRSADVDLNNEDEKYYDSFLLQKLFRVQ